MDTLESREQDVINLTKEINNKNNTIQAQQLQIYNLKRNLELLGNALDQKDVLIARLYLRCWLLSSGKACACCPQREHCSMITQRMMTGTKPILGCDYVYEFMKHNKGDAIDEKT